MRRHTTLTLLAAMVVAAGAAPAETGYGDSPLFALNTVAVSGVVPGGGAPLADALGPCHPNPFNPGTSIAYALQGPARVHLAVYDLRGRLVRELLTGQTVPAGNHTASWDGRDRAGRAAAGGVYLYRLRTEDFAATRRMTLLK